jgi:alpha-L-fucosidase
LALSQGNVPAWLPMISDCAIYPPESYIFRVGIILSAALLNLNSVMMLFYQHNVKPGGATCFDKVTLSLASLGCAGLMVVGAVNEKENNTIHSTGAIIFFVCYEIYILCITYSMWDFSGPKSTNLIIKLALSIYGLVALILFAFMSSNWGKYGTDIAFCEWTGTIAIILFNMTFVYEYGDNLHLAAILNNSGNTLPHVVKPAIPMTPPGFPNGGYYPVYTVPAMFPPQAFYPQFPKAGEMPQYPSFNNSAV